ncbi:hypothetical protein GCM10010406_13390 [Streptomyces thermolineatus]|uniref:DUF1963 domain-containing protein n=1 Tax=Streptomyces thermolineatus TaxID=44033 RepID=A0ABN3L683_9ACTN
MPERSSLVAELVHSFPELREYFRTALLLEPQPGEPGPHESSVGGPLLWPADEEWPVCTEDHLVGHHEDLSAEERSVLEGARRTGTERRSGGNSVLTEEEASAYDRISARGEVIDTVSWQVHSLRPETPAAGVAMVPVLQLFAGDVPGVEWPEGTDLLQILWCPNDHDTPPGQEPYYFGPTVALRRRRAGDVRDVLASPPAPCRTADHYYLPRPCTVAPAEALDLPDRDELPPDLWERVERWRGGTGRTDYYDLACVQGWKLGGWPTWRVTDLEEINCVCGSRMRLFLTVDSDDAPGLVIGRGGRLQIFQCPEDIGHPLRLNTQ